MKDIYFKAKATLDGVWVEGMPYKGLDVGLKVYTGIMQYFEHDGEKVCDYEKIKVDPDTLCVWTGQVDSEGRRIYTGDKVQVTFAPNFFNDNECEAVEVLTVYWDESQTAFMCKSNTCKQPTDCCFTEEADVTYKVIGNIHDEVE